jgi:hypothetical protein
MAKARFNGKTYEVKPTSKVRTIERNAHYDFNGYYNEASTETREQLGLYDEVGNKAFTVNEAGDVFSGSGKRIGTARIDK